MRRASYNIEQILKCLRPFTLLPDYQLHLWTKITNKHRNISSSSSSVDVFFDWKIEEQKRCNRIKISIKYNNLATDLLFHWNCIGNNKMSEKWTCSAWIECSNSIIFILCVCVCVYQSARPCASHTNMAILICGHNKSTLILEVARCNHYHSFNYNNE